MNHQGRFDRRRGGGWRRSGQRGGGRIPGRGRGTPFRVHDHNPAVIEELGTPTDDSITIAVEGCCHGELDAIYDRLLRHEKESGRKIDLLLCCGDFQSLRNMADFHSLAVPPKYRALGSFYQYYAGKRAPILTVFVGGNHEASQPLQELYYGGWVAPNIYYLGAAGVVSFRGIRIGGISGIYKPHDYELGRFEKPPYDNSTLRSVYHVRHLDVYRLLCLTNGSARGGSTLDIMVSHDWPQGIEQHGDTQGLLRRKPFFRDEVQRNCLGSPPNRELLDSLRPRLWFSAHLHVKFKATVHHREKIQEETRDDQNPSLVPSQVLKTSSDVAPNEAKRENEPQVAESGSSNTTQFFAPAESSTGPCKGSDLTDLMTQFLSLDKCLPRRHYLSILHFPNQIGGPRKDEGSSLLEYDAEWLAILQKTHHLSSKDRCRVQIPSEPLHVTQEDITRITEQFESNLTIPAGFEQTVPAHAGPPSPLPRPLPPPFPAMGNPQTDRLLNRLGLEHKVTIPFNSTLADSSLGLACKPTPEDENEIELEEEDEQDYETVGCDDGEEVKGTAATASVPETEGIKRPRLESN